MVEFVSSPAPKPLIELGQKSKHALRRDPLCLGGLIYAEMVSPLHMAKPVEPSMDSINRWGAEWEIWRHRKREAFVVVQRQSVFGALVVRAIETDIDD